MPLKYTTEISSEEQLLLSLCRIDFNEGQKVEIGGLVKKIADWNHFIHLANEHCVLPLCWFNLNQTGNTAIIPDKVTKILYTGYLKNIAQNALIDRQVSEIESIAQKGNIKIVLLKGATLEKTVYGNAGLRHMSDIDLLVDPGEAIELRKLMLEAGFNSFPLISPLHKNLLPYLKNHLPVLEKNGVFVEIHVRLFDDISHQLTKRLLDSSTLADSDDNVLFYPEPQMHFLYLLKHLERHLRTKDPKLKFYCDVFLLLTTHKEQILDSRFAELLRTSDLIEPFIAISEVMEIFWDLKLMPVYEYPSTKPDEASTWKFLQLLRNPINYRGEMVNEGLLKPLKEIPGGLYKLLFLIGYIFPSLSYLKYKFSTGSKLKAMLFYPVRWTMLIKRITASL